MAERLTLPIESRRGSAGAVRSGGAVPAVVYGHGVEPEAVEVNAKELARIYMQAGETTLVNLTKGSGAPRPVLIREVQLHPLKDTLLHVDFYQVRMDEVIRAHVPLEFTGVSSAVKDHGGILVRSLDAIEIEALPQDLPHDIKVDISGLDTFEKVVHIRDLHIPKGVTVLHGDDEVVALVQEPKSQEEIDAELAEEIKEDVEAVEGVKEKEPEAEAAEGEAAAADQAASKEEEKK